MGNSPLFHELTVWLVVIGTAFFAEGHAGKIGPNYEKYPWRAFT